MVELPAVVARYLEAYNRKQIANMVACFVDDLRFEHVSNTAGGPHVLGKAALFALAEQSAALFRERQQSVLRAIVQDDQVALEIAFRAVVAQDLPNGWRAGQTIELRGASFFRLRDGLIAELVDLS